MEYSAGQELVDILLHFGFKEDTDKIYPVQYEQMKHRGEYNPHSFKRSFFDEMAISLEELVSLIYFMQLSSSDRAYMFSKLRGDKITDLYDFLNDTDACHYSHSTLNKLNRHKQEIMYFKSKVLNYKNFERSM